MQPTVSAQNSRPEVDLKSTPTGIFWHAWEKMNARWQSYAAIVIIQKKGRITNAKKESPFEVPLSL